MINFDDVRKQNIKEHNPNWPQITIVDCGSGKTNSLFNLMISY